MPYVLRNIRGKICSVSSWKQPDSEEVFLPDNNPEVLKFMEGAPPRPPAPTAKDMERARREDARLRAELEVMNTALLNHMRFWAEMEMGLGALLYQLLNLRPAGSNISHAIYYSAPHFEVRRNIVADVVAQFTIENPKCRDLGAKWKLVNDQIEKAQKKRNIIAHGAPLNVPGQKRRELRLTSPAFDLKRVTNKLRAGSVPGLSCQEVAASVHLLVKIQENLDKLNRGIDAFRARKYRIMKKEFSSVTE